MSELLTPKVILLLKTMAKDLGKWYYTRELAKLSNVGLGTVSSEFRKLAKDGLLEFKTEGQEKYYKLNLANPKTRKMCELFETEKREKFFKENRRLAWILEDLTKKASDFVPEVQSVVLFGSMARGEATQRSDIDVLVIVPDYDEQKFKQLMDSIDNLAREVSGIHPTRLAAVVMSMKDFEQGLRDKKRFAADVLKDGIVLFGEGRCYHLLSKVI
nr:nucleotidyltransferase domain-containing protein [Candidatus Njordarchaeum guaymaensis]